MIGFPFRSRVALGRTNLVAALGCCVVLGLGGGCGAAVYSVHVVRATRAVERAKQVGAAQHSPFELALAANYLDKAREESAEAAYEDAIRFAKLAEALGKTAADNSFGATQAREESASHE